MQSAECGHLGETSAGSRVKVQMIPELSLVFLSAFGKIGGGVSEGYFAQSPLVMCVLEMHKDGPDCQRGYGKK